MHLLRSNQRRGAQGNILPIMLILGSVMAFMLASYLNMVRAQNRIVNRSLAWNRALPLAEAGLEEALVHLQTVGQGNRAAHGWIEQDGKFILERTLSDGRYSVQIGSSLAPDITSVGYALESITGDEIRRVVRITTTTGALFAKGMVAKNNMLFNGIVTTDSFDSEDPAFSSYGQYDPAKRKDNGDIATNSRIAGAIDMNGQVKIFGSAATGPGGSLSMNAQTAVGTENWIDQGGRGIQAGRYSDDMNVTFPDVEEPFSGGAFTPAGGDVDGTEYTHILNSGNYQLDSLNLSGQERVLVQGDAILYVRGTVKLTGSAFIQISTNASLKLYVGEDATLAGNGIVNQTQSAEAFSLWGLPTCTEVKFSGNAAFTGTIYAPQADLVLQGGGNDVIDFIGASISNEVQMGGRYQFHYDEKLSRNNDGGALKITSWNEIAPESGT